MTYKCLGCGHPANSQNPLDAICYKCRWMLAELKAHRDEQDALDRETAETSRQIEEGWLL